LCYCFYVPLLSFGQIVPFSEFKTQVFPDVYVAVKLLSKIIFWSVFMEFSNHFIYAFALLHSTYILSDMSLLSLAGMAYWISQLFTVKYIILWSFTSLVTHFDHIQTPPLPGCTSKFFHVSSVW
ncbi:hypothetical protein HELRODRAFT_135643, partial [Helobdella robusta]